MEIQANPDVQHLQVLLIVLIPVLLISAGIIGYFLKKTGDAINSMSLTLENIRIEFATLKSKVDTESPSVSQRLDSHSRVLDRHESILTRLQTEHTLIHKNCLPHEKD